MLVLERRRGERIMIGDDITIRVVEIHGETVQLGIEAPKEIRVDREEIRRRIEREGLRHE
jgi:carbon storage regulator